QLLQNETINELKRKGKFLLFELDHYTLVSHLRMEGKYGVHLSGEKKDKHTHVIFQLESGKALCYNDVRKFGTMHLFPKGEALKSAPLNKLGPDPFEDDYLLEEIFPKIKKSKRAIK